MDASRATFTYLMWMVQLSPLGDPVFASSLVKVSDCRDPVRSSLSILALVVISAPPEDNGLEVDDAQPSCPYP